MGNIIKPHLKPIEKPLLMLIIDNNDEIVNYYSNSILNNPQIRERFSILKTTTINPDKYLTFDVNIGTTINKYSSIDPTKHTIKEIVDDLIIITDNCIFMINEKSYHRENKLKKIGI